MPGTCIQYMLCEYISIYEPSEPSQYLHPVCVKCFVGMNMSTVAENSFLLPHHRCDVLRLWGTVRVPALFTMPFRCPPAGTLHHHPRHPLWLRKGLLPVEADERNRCPLCPVCHLRPRRGRGAGVWPCRKHRVPAVRFGHLLRGQKLQPDLHAMLPVQRGWGGDPAVPGQVRHTLHGWVHDTETGADP